MSVFALLVALAAAQVVAGSTAGGPGPHGAAPDAGPRGPALVASGTGARGLALAGTRRARPQPALLCSASSAAAGLAAGAHAPALDRASAALRRWVGRFERRGDDHGGAAAAELRAILGDLRIQSRRGGKELDDALFALLDLHAAAREAAGSVEPRRIAAGEELRTAALAELGLLLDATRVRWLCARVLLDLDQPVARRVSACELVHGERGLAVLLGLEACAREGTPALRAAALESLVGWERPQVHALFLERLEAGDARERWYAEEHFASLRLDPASELSVELAQAVERGLAARGWRDASGAVRVSAALADAAAVPLLIAGFEHWLGASSVASNGAHDPARASRRIAGEITSALRARSGLSIGPRPEDWTTWWSAVESGEHLTRDRAAASEGRTRASFFGLRPVTDRVTFVLDRSGSMQALFRQAGPGGASTGRDRYHEAVEQMLAFLEGLGDSARFDIVLFAEECERWPARLVPASSTNLRAARSWLLRRRPAGGTELRPALERALHVDSEGRVELARLEADTLVVLCDGATDEGPSWVAPFLRRVQPSARVVVHAVQIGAHGDGTLERLAAGTGGEFVPILGD